MHEFSICGRIVDAVLSELQTVEPSARLLCTRVVVGELHQIVPDYLQFAYHTLTRDTAADGSILEVEFKPVVVECRRCEWRGAIEPPIFRCGRCHALEVDMTGGKELYIEHLEIETPTDPDTV